MNKTTLEPIKMNIENDEEDETETITIFEYCFPSNYEGNITLPCFILHLMLIIFDIIGLYFSLAKDNSNCNSIILNPNTYLFYSCLIQLISIFIVQIFTRICYFMINNCKSYIFGEMCIYFVGLICCTLKFNRIYFVLEQLCLFVWIIIGFIIRYNENYTINNCENSINILIPFWCIYQIIFFIPITFFGFIFSIQSTTAPDLFDD